MSNAARACVAELVDLAITELVGTLSVEDVVITTAEKDALRELMEHCREPLTYLEQIRTSAEVLRDAAGEAPSPRDGSPS